MVGFVRNLLRRAAQTRPQVRLFSHGASKSPNMPRYGKFAAAVVGGGLVFAVGAHHPAHAESQAEAAKNDSMLESVLKTTGISAWIDYVREPAERPGCPKGKLLADPPALPPGVVQRTLVLGLEDCLIHTEWERKRGHRTKKRPGLDAFLAHVSQFYEVVIFTTAMSSYGQPIANILQETGYVQQALFREHCKLEGGKPIKDLSYLNRDLRHVIIVDTHPEHYVNQPHNAIHIKEWSGDVEDTQLLELVPFLDAVFREDIPDVRQVLAAMPADQIPEKFRELKHQCLERKKKGVVMGRSRAPAGVMPVLSSVVPHKPHVIPGPSPHPHHVISHHTTEHKFEGKHESGEAKAGEAGEEKHAEKHSEKHFDNKKIFMKAKAPSVNF